MMMMTEHDSGFPLSQLLKKNHLFSEPKLVRVLIPILDELKRAHDKGYIHRGINPASIYIRNDNSWSWLTSDFQRQNRQNKSKPPASDTYTPFEGYGVEGEQSHQGPWSDIYSLAATLYHAITGRPPKHALDRASAILAGKEDTYESLAPQSDRYLKYSQGFLRAIDSALNFKGHQRPQSVKAWSRMLIGKSAVARSKPRSPAASISAIGGGKSSASAGELRTRYRPAIAIEASVVKKAEASEFVVASGKSPWFGSFATVVFVFTCLGCVVWVWWSLFGLGRVFMPSDPGDLIAQQPPQNEDVVVDEPPITARQAGDALPQKISPIEQIQEKLVRLDDAMVPYAFKLLTRYQLYRDILKIEPYHSESLQGIDAIYRDIAKTAGSALQSGKLKSAQDRLNLLKQLGGPEDSIQRIENGIREQQASQAAAVIAATKNQAPAPVKDKPVVVKSAAPIPTAVALKTPVALKPKVNSATKKIQAKPKINLDSSVEAALKKIETFNVSFELGDVSALERVAKVSEKNKDFLSSLFKEYSLTNVEIIRVNHIKSKNVVVAEVEITKLINRDGYMVAPSQSWSTIPLTAKFNKNSGWEVFW